MFRIIILFFLTLTCCETTTHHSNFEEEQIIRRFSNYSDFHDLYIDFDQNNDSLSVNNLKKVSGEVSKLDGFYQIKFYSVSGGGHSVGNKVIKNIHGDEHKGRLIVTCDSIEHKLSVNEILGWPSKMIGDENIYVAPKICTD